MMKNTEIREIDIKSNYDLIAGFMRQLHEHERQLFDKTAAWHDIEEGYMRHIMEMQKECEGVCLVAYTEGNAAGFIFGYVQEQDDSRIEVYEGKELYVSDGYIEEAYRRMGIYKQLNDQLEQHFISMGVRRITRFTLVNNVRMRQLLEDEGYSVTRLLFEKWVE